MRYFALLLSVELIFILSKEHFSRAMFVQKYVNSIEVCMRNEFCLVGQGTLGYFHHKNKLLKSLNRHCKAELNAYCAILERLCVKACNNL